MLDIKFRDPIEKVVRPVGQALVKAGFTANRLTALGLALNVVAAAIVATGRVVVALIVGGVANLIDMLDGATAKAGQTTSRRGAFFDSVADRVSETAVFTGVAWHFYAAGSRLAVLCVAVLGLSLITSYERARAESLGLDGRGGLFERGERLIVLGLALAIPGAAAIGLWVLLGGTLLTVVQRFAGVWRQTEPAPAPVGVRPFRLGAARLERRRAYIREIPREIPADSAANEDEADEFEADEFEADVDELAEAPAAVGFDGKVLNAFVPRRMRERFNERSQRRPHRSSTKRRRARGA